MSQLPRSFLDELDSEVGAIIVAPRTWRYRLRHGTRVAALATACLVLIAAAGIAGYALWLQSLAPPPVNFAKAVPNAQPRPEAVPNSGMNFLLLGSDSRDGLTQAELAEMATEGVGGRRTDTIILVHLSADRKRTVLVSFPRDAWVPIPGYGNGKINTAFGKGGSVEDGANLLRATIEDMSGIRIDHYLEVDFRGFLDVVDALGGVDICLSKPARDPMAGLNLSAGKHTVKGAQALGFVRARHFDPRSDYGRIERQQQFLAAMLRKATTTSVLLNPVKLNQLLTSGIQAVRRDQNLGVSEIRRLVEGLHGLDPGKVTFVTAPVSGGGFAGEQSVVYLDHSAGEELWQALREDGPLPPIRAATPPPAASPSGSAAPSASASPAAGPTPAKPSPSSSTKPPVRTGIAPLPFEQTTAADDPCKKK